jgi:hypothetical protein
VAQIAYNKPSRAADGGFIVTWSNLTENDTATPFPVSGYPDKSIEVTGTFGGGTVACQGSNHLLLAEADRIYLTLRDPHGSPVTFTANGLRAILENVTLIRPALSGGVGMSITAALLVSNVARRGPAS